MRDSVEDKDAIDTTIIEGLIAEIGPESMARVLDAMASDAERLLIGLQWALEADDQKGFCLFAHSLKSNSLTVGAVKVGALFHELEATAGNGPLLAMQSRVQQATAEYRRLIGFILTVPDSDPQIKLSSAG
jgi:HPt (histidine-containing phosphotransfer) domain-containing protein